MITLKTSPFGENTLKLAVIQYASCKGYGLYEIRVVEVPPGKQGYKSERGVVTHWQSQGLYRPMAGGKGLDARNDGETEFNRLLSQKAGA